MKPNTILSYDQFATRLVRQFSLTEIDPDRVTLFLLNGGGQHPYNKFHKITKLFTKFNCNIISLELPGHGKSSFANTQSPDQILSDFYTTFSDIISKHSKVALFGYSLGALFSLKAIQCQMHEFEFVIGVGAGMVVTKNEERVMKKYASIEFFEKMKWDKIMVEYHSEGWKYLIDSMPQMLSVNSPLFVGEDFTSNSPLHMIIGDNDKVVNYDQQQNLTNQSNIHTHKIDNTNHFDYFSKSWDVTSKLIISITKNHLTKR